MAENSVRVVVRVLRATFMTLGVMGVIAAFLAIISLSTGTQGNIPNPLAPPATESPRATLASFREAVNAAEKIVQDAYKAHVAEPGLFQSKETRAKVREAQAHLARAIRTFDTSEIAPSIRQRTSLEAAMQLEEVFERVKLPEAGAIPDADAMKARTEKGDRAQWTIPNTEIRIARIESGARAGEYLFTAETVSRAYEFYRRSRDLASEDRFNFYEFYALSPGDLMPPKWYAHIEQLPEWFLEEYHDNARWQWLGLAGTIVLAILFCFAVYRWTWRQGAAPRLPLMLKSTLLPAAVLLAAVISDLFIQELNITGPVRSSLITTLEVAVYGSVAWLIAAIFNRLSVSAAATWGGRTQSFDSGIIRVAIGCIGIALAIGIVVFGAHRIGVPLIGILAGLGVGGLAFALAAQPTLENFIGGVMIYADRPVRVGDHCKFGDMTGVVEEIGVRSTRVRASDRSLVSIPNADFSKLQLVNYSRRDQNLFNAKIGVQYGASQEQLSKILDGMRKLLKTSPRVQVASGRVNFTSFGGQSIEINVTAEMRNVESGSLADATEELMIELFKVVERSGASLAGHG